MEIVTVDKQTRIGVGAGAMIALILYFVPNLGWPLAASAIFVCALVACWGLWPIITGGKEPLLRYWETSAKKDAMRVGLVLLGIGIGLVIAHRSLLVWTTVTDTGPIAWNFEDTARGHGYFLDMQKTGDQEVTVAGFGAVGKNIKSEPIDDFEGYIRSDLTNKKSPIYVMAANAGTAHACMLSVPTPPEETLGIPAFSLFAVVTHKKPLYVNIPYDDSVSATKFKNEFAPFTVVMKYAGKEYKRQFSRAEVDLQLAIFTKASDPPSNPYVARKETAPPITSFAATHSSNQTKRHSDPIKSRSNGHGI